MSWAQLLKRVFAIDMATCPHFGGPLTIIAGIRHCPECNWDVHLALTEEDFRRHADEGQCVAVRVLQVHVLEEDRIEDLWVGKVKAPYNAHLKSL